MNTTEKAIVEIVTQLSEVQQQQVLLYAQQQLDQPTQPAVDGETVVTLIRRLDFALQDVDAMAQAIEVL